MEVSWQTPSLFSHRTERKQDGVPQRNSAAGVCVCIRRTAGWKPSFFQPPESSTHTHSCAVSMLSSSLHSRSVLRGRWWHHYYSSSAISPINREAAMSSSELTPDGWSHPMRICSSNTHTYHTSTGKLRHLHSKQ